MDPQISVGQFVPQERKTAINKILISVADAILGLNKMERLYRANDMQGLSKEAFAAKMLQVFDVNIAELENFVRSIPKEGPLLLTSNHPFGGLEGVILAKVLGEIRPDLKVLANFALQIFPELSEYFIFTNPLSEKNPKNGPSLRQCMKHFQSGGALLVFPAGRVSYFQADKGRISEHEWNRMVGRIIEKTDAQHVPIFVNGKNSDWFYRWGRIYYRIRMILLGRELLNKRGQTIQLSSGNAVANKEFSSMSNNQELAALLRAQSYAQEASWRSNWPTSVEANLEPLAAEPDYQVIQEEIAQLPAEQHLVDYKEFSVYFGFRHQMPNVVTEIARQRERVFREHDEGSGEPIDTDDFDDTYTQLFIVNNTDGKIIGAYRMGQTDKLLKKGGMEQLYLSQMFDFGPDFINRNEPCLEMGRSFLVPEYQRSFYGLYLLWRGIGAFVCKFPQYRVLYGTVSLSKLYDKRSIAIIEQALVLPQSAVKPRKNFDFSVHPEIADFAKEYDLTTHLSTFLKGIESDGKDIPILLKHYMKMGAQFHCLGMDPNFAGTPGLLLSVDLTKAPQKQLKQYMSDGLAEYLAHHQ